jgi:subfamily B ATP-binding cassette protein MsbA
MAESSATPKKPRVNMARAWAEARALIWKHRKSLAVGLVLMLINRLAGLVLPASSKYLIDDVLGKQQLTKLVPLALAGGGATVVQANTSL